MNYQFPGTNGAAGKAKAAIGAHREPSAEEWSWLSNCETERQTADAKAAKAKEKADRAAAWTSREPTSRLVPERILREFGVVSDEQLAAWAALSEEEDESAEEESDEGY